jgi:hypothetical protein
MKCHKKVKYLIKMKLQQQMEKIKNLNIKVRII